MNKNKKIQAFFDDIPSSGLSIEKRKELTSRLAELLIESIDEDQSLSEGLLEKQFMRMMKDFKGRVFTTLVTDRSFRTKSTYTTMSQVAYLIDKYGVPQYFSFFKRLSLHIICWLGQYFSKFFAPLFLSYSKYQMCRILIQNETKSVEQYINQARRNYETVNLNHLGEAILGEKEAQRRLDTYLKDLKTDHIEYISVKVSTLYSQLHLLSYDKSLEILSSRLRLLYRESLKYVFVDSWGNVKKKFVNLDMEEYRDFALTLELFMKVLDEEEFLKYRAGIVLQAYLPDSFEALKQLTAWSKKRVERGGVPVKVRLVKGANLANEKVEASQKGWPLATFKHKSKVDAHFKAMFHYALESENLKYVHLGVASHNLFDLSYAMIRVYEDKLDSCVTFEVLQGMANPLKRVINGIFPGVVVYTPTASNEEFHQSIAYLLRRLDENCAQENFLRYFFGLNVLSPAWKQEESKFLKALEASYDFSKQKPHRLQNRIKGVRCCQRQERDRFYNESNTDFTVMDNRKWAKEIVAKYQGKNFGKLCSVIGGKESLNGAYYEGKDICLDQGIYTYALMEKSQLKTVEVAVKQGQDLLTSMPLDDLLELLHRIEKRLIDSRGHFIGCMMADSAKTFEEADAEVSEAIDFIRYYSLERKTWRLWEKEAAFSSKGPCLVLAPWNFPLAIPMGGVVSALLTGNAVVFKPSLETSLVAYEMAKLFWEAGLPPSCLNFILCEDKSVGSSLVKAPFIKQVILTGSTQTAEHLITLRQGLQLSAETGGKNSIIVTRLSDRDLAVKNIIHSAFSHSGQKCSACSLLICEQEVYRSEEFQSQIYDAASSLSVGSVWDLSTRVGPLLKPPSTAVRKGLKEIEKDETWLLAPRCLDTKGHLWSPGIKMGVQMGSHSHQQEFFAPLLSMMEAKHLDHALEIANSTSYGLTAGLQSLDEREHEKWKKVIQAGNLYINREITGAIVRRQPFGGVKASNYGIGFKAGGPNYLKQFVCFENQSQSLPPYEGSFPQLLKPLKDFARHYLCEKDFLEWKKIMLSYDKAYQDHFIIAHDYSHLIGQDNLHYYYSKPVLIKGDEHTSALDILCILSCATLSQSPVHLYLPSHERFEKMKSHGPISFKIHTLSDESFLQALAPGDFVRFLSSPPTNLQKAMQDKGLLFFTQKVLFQGRLELLYYFKEQALSYDFHRYGNLGERELIH